MLSTEQNNLIDATFDRIERLPTLPDISVRINELVNDPKASMRQMEAIIENDPLMSSTVLKVVNSSFYGMAKEISSLRLALVILGTREIKNLVLSLTVFRLFAETKFQQYFDYKQFWFHSAVTGQIAKSLAKNLQIQFEGADFVGGLIHDIGKIVLLQNVADEYLPLLKETTITGNPLWTLEMERFGFHHGHVGGWLALQWRLPRRLVAAMMYHNEPENTQQYQSLVSVVSLANALAHQQEEDPSAKDIIPLIQEHPATDVLMAHVSGLEAINWELFTEELQTDLEKAWQFVSLSQGGLWQTA